MKNKTTITLVLLFLFSFILRALFLIYVAGLNAPLTGDMPAYHNGAVSFLEGKGLMEGGAERGPFLSILLVGIYSLTGSDPAAARWLLVVISAVTVPLVFILTRLLFPGKNSAALWAAVIWAFYPPSIFFSAQVLTETTSAFLSVICMWAFLSAAAGRRLGQALGLGLLLGFMSLNRSTFFLFPFSLFVVQYILKRFIKINSCLSARQWLVVLISFLLVLSPWVIRNYRIYRVFIPGEYRIGTMLHMCNWNLEHPVTQSGGYYKEPDGGAQYEKLSTLQAERLKVQVVIAEVRRNWRCLPKVIFMRAVNFWNFRPDPYDKNWTRNDWIMLLIGLPVAVSFLLSFREFPWAEDWMLLFMIFYTFIFVLPFWGTPRFRFPIDPFIIMRAGIGLTWLLSKIRLRRLSNL